VGHPERIVPLETEPGIVAIHLSRYRFAAPLCAGKLVLDIACGVGYGSAALALTAERVLGIDRSADAIDYAKRQYGAQNVEFQEGDVHSLAVPDASFDVVCSFETIEHVDDPPRALGELARVLRDDGTLVVSTPNARVTTNEPSNPFHRTEWTAPDFEQLALRSFERVELYGQQRVQSSAHRLAQRLDVLGLRRRLRFLRRASPLLGTRAMEHMTEDDVAILLGRLDGASEIVAVCTAPRR
jgi:2-polyprenyl-3-methyl-5-hydroxy-6-metoxy-1,4-benzoquinol methylase